MGSKYYRHGKGFENLLKRKVPPGVYVYNGTWVQGNAFDINMCDDYVRKLHENQRLPYLIEHTKSWVVCFVFSIVFMLFNVWYEMIIPYFERTMDESTAEFMMIDDIVYYCQFVFPLLLFIAYMLAKVKADSIKYAWAVETVAYYDNLRKTDLEGAMKALGHYEVTCPSCGASNTEGTETCEYCGRNLRIS